MSAESIVTAVLTQVLDLDDADIQPDHALDSLLDWDSVNALRTLMLLERELGTPVDFHRFSEVRTVAELCGLVRATAGEPAGGPR